MARKAKLNPGSKRVALYLRVSTLDKGQTTANQEHALRAWAERAGHEVVGVFSDEGASGAKGRDKRPGLDGMVRAAARREFDVVAAWDLSRLGRSLAHVVVVLEELRAQGVGLYLDRQAIDTGTAMGKAMLGMAAVFAELERDFLRERTVAGLERARREGKRLGRPKVATPSVVRKVKRARQRGLSLRRIAADLGVSAGTVHAVLKEDGA